MALKGSFPSVFSTPLAYLAQKVVAMYPPYMSSQMLAPRKTQIARRKISTEKALALFLLGGGPARGVPAILRAVVLPFRRAIGYRVLAVFLWRDRAPRAGGRDGGVFRLDSRSGLLLFICHALSPVPWLCRRIALGEQGRVGWRVAVVDGQERRGHGCHVMDGRVSASLCVPAQGVSRDLS